MDQEQDDSLFHKEPTRVPYLSESETEDRNNIEVLIDKKIAAFDTPYQSSTEALPKMAAYHPSFGKVEAQYEGLLAAAAELLESSKYHDSHTERFLRETLKYRKVKYPQSRVIGLVGDSGVGKSSLINAILDTPALALTGATGSACTCVITEFRRPWPLQKSGFRAEIALFDQEKITSVLRGHLEDYWMANFEDNDVPDTDGLKYAKIQADNAVEVFQALFANHLDFHDKATIEAFLRQMREPADEVMLKKMVRWTNDLITNSGAVNRLIYKSAETGSDLGKEIEPFSKMGAAVGSSLAPSLWPIVEIVRIGLRTHLLQRGVVIADFPGLSDLNSTRTNATNNYIHSCDYIFLVAPIARVQTDNLVDRRIFEYTQRFGSRFALICTKTDDVPEKANPQDFLATDKESREHQEMARIQQRMGAHKTELSNQKKIAKGEAKDKLNQELNNLSLRRRICEVLLRESILMMRNRKVELAMRSKHSGKEAGNETLKIWCVSSVDYHMNARGFDEEMIPVSVYSTGISQLRAFILRMPAEEKLDILRLHCQGYLPELLGSMKMWNVQATIHRRLEAREVVAKPRRCAEVALSQFLQKIKTHLDGTILDAIRDSTPGWIDHGKNHLDKIAKKAKCVSHRAWCSHKGKHSSRTHPNWDWNAGFLEPVLRDLRTPWQKFDKACDKASKDCLSNLTELLDGIRVDLSAIDDVVVIPTAPFMQSLAPKKLQLQNIMKTFLGKFREFNNGPRLRVITGDTDESYLLKALSPAYQSCTRIRGTGSYNRRKALLRDTMSRGVPFAGMEAGLKKEIEDELDSRAQKFVDKVQDVFSKVLVDFDSMFSIEERPNVERERLRGAIDDFANKADAILQGPIEEELSRAIADSD